MLNMYLYTDICLYSKVLVIVSMRASHAIVVLYNIRYDTVVCVYTHAVQLLEAGLVGQPTGTTVVSS